MLNSFRSRRNSARHHLDSITMLATFLWTEINWKWSSSSDIPERVGFREFEYTAKFGYNVDLRITNTITNSWFAPYNLTFAVLTNYNLGTMPQNVDQKVRSLTVVV